MAYFFRELVLFLLTPIDKDERASNSEGGSSSASLVLASTSPGKSQQTTVVSLLEGLRLAASVYMGLQSKSSNPSPKKRARISGGGEEPSPEEAKGAATLEISRRITAAAATIHAATLEARASGR